MTVEIQSVHSFASYLNGSVRIQCVTKLHLSSMIGSLLDFSLDLYIPAAKRSPLSGFTLRSHQKLIRDTLLHLWLYARFALFAPSRGAGLISMALLCGNGYHFPHPQWKNEPLVLLYLLRTSHKRRNISRPRVCVHNIPRRLTQRQHVWMTAASSAMTAAAAAN